jgi:hypothetical protein
MELPNRVVEWLPSASCLAFGEPVGPSTSRDKRDELGDLPSRRYTRSSQYDHTLQYVPPFLLVLWSEELNNSHARTTGLVKLSGRDA